jgi:hypothetical protein
VQIYRSPKGIWHIEYERMDGQHRWSTLGTRNEAKAKAEFEKMKLALERAWDAKTNLRGEA